MTDSNDRTMYGVWIPGEGWLKGKDIFADYSYDKTKQVARLIGRGAKVLFIDKSIVELESFYLARERRTIWHTLMSFLASKVRLFSSSK